jgi:hypothetical protein
MAGRNGVVLTDAALAKLKAERYEKVNEHLEQLGQQVAIRNGCLDVVVSAALKNQGLPTGDEQAAFLTEARRLADAMSAMKLRDFHERGKALLAELKVSDVPDAIVWSARQCGVELVERTDN